MIHKFYGNGKLLITGEYAVLDGANALALPTKFGQDLVIENGSNHEILWKSYDSDGSIWFEDTLAFSSISKKKRTDSSVKNTLIDILHEAYLLHPEFLTSSDGYTITTNLTFPKKWGLGTSSTLINNIAQWLEIDAFMLLKNSFGGSGYDIACAQNNSPIIYHLENGSPFIEQVTFNPKFHSKLYFVYLNQKQNSKEAIASYRKKNFNAELLISEINNLTESILKSSGLAQFRSLLEKHEVLMSGILGLKPVKEDLFPDFNGTIKSLGAWGGDFVMAVSDENPVAYFKSKGFETVIPYESMIL